MDHTSINQIIIDIMVIFMVLGGVDRCLGGKFGLASQFEEGFNAWGPLAVGMIGFVCLAPVLGSVLTPVVSPLYKLLGADPAMFATTLLACDMGGYPLAMEMAETTEAGQFAGILLGSTMGCTVVFSIPVFLSMVDKKNHTYLATGILCGVVTIPVGCFIGGLVAGFTLTMVLRNLIPIIIVAGLIALGLALIPNRLIKGFTVFGRIMTILGTVGLVCAIVEYLTGVVVIPGMAPVTDGLATVGSIAIVLAGAYPMVAVIMKVFGKPLSKVGKLIGINEKAAGGLVASLANALPMVPLVEDMDPVGKTVNFAFIVSGAFVFGDHLGFTAGVEKDMVVPMICCKLVGGILAVILAMFVAKKRYKDEAAPAAAKE